MLSKETISFEIADGQTTSNSDPIDGVRSGYIVRIDLNLPDVGASTFTLNILSPNSLVLYTKATIPDNGYSFLTDFYTTWPHGIPICQTIGSAWPAQGAHAAQLVSSGAVSGAKTATATLFWEDWR